jgi:hypothetical protein
MTEEALFTLVSWLVAAVAVPMSAQLISSSWSTRRPLPVDLRGDAIRRVDEIDHPLSQRR